MGAKSGIEWTGATWNPIRGCSMAKGSETGGCLNCYAARMSARNLPDLRSPTTGKSFARILPSGPRWTGEVELIEKALELPLRWKKPRKIFVNSMSDLLHESLPDEAIDRIVAVMAICPKHTFQVLTKRGERLRSHFASRHSRRLVSDQLEAMGCRASALSLIDRWPLPNLWLGVSVENQATADARIPLLLQTPAAKRFISYEPALGAVDLSNWLSIAWQCSGCRNYFGGSYEKICPSCKRDSYWTGSHKFNTSDGRQRGPALDWVICGGESGPGARPMHPDWARSVRDQCVAAGVPFFIKQWGAFQPGSKERGGVMDYVVLSDGRHCREEDLEAFQKANPDTVEPVGRWIGMLPESMARVGKKAAGSLLDGREWKEFPA